MSGVLVDRELLEQLIAPEVTTGQNPEDFFYCRHCEAHWTNKTEGEEYHARGCPVPSLRAALALPAQAAADAAGVQDEERLEYHKSEMRRLEGGERETRQLWSAHMNLVEALDMRIRTEKRVAYWETHLRALEEQS